MKNIILLACAFLSLDAYSAPSNKFTCHNVGGDEDGTVYVDLKAKAAGYFQEDSNDIAFSHSSHVLRSGETLHTFKSRDGKLFIDFFLLAKKAQVRVNATNVSGEFKCKDDPSLNLIPDLIQGRYGNSEGCKAQITCWDVEIYENDRLFCNAVIIDSFNVVDLVKANAFRAADGIRILKVSSPEGEAPVRQSGMFTLNSDGELTAELSLKAGSFEKKVKCESLRPIP